MKYTHEKLNEHITRITDIAGVACYLVEGSKRACLLDTCCGYGDLKEYVRTLTDQAVFVILTHGHYDHTGSAALFDEVYMNQKDLPVLENHNRRRLFFFEEDQKSIPALKEITFEMINPLLEKIPSEIKDTQMFDLGNIHIKMIEVPGHTPCMMCPYIPELKTIFFGDACGTSVLLHEETSTDVSTYKNSLIRLKQMEDQYDVIYRNHGSYTNDKQLLDNVMECCDMILHHRDDHHPTIMYGKTIYETIERINGKRKDGKEGNILYASEKAG